mmetsp:Transcript_15308/g.45887  ORF Transcript_15308/g.45887 Transcript_15308/m.45887 type:complete len:429 (-) Transcript_15308:74-1360(-)
MALTLLALVLQHPLVARTLQPGPPRRAARARRVVAAADVAPDFAESPAANTYVGDESVPPGPYAVSWLATDQGKDSEKWIEFDERHYMSMVQDKPRTDAFVRALQERLAAFPPGTATVLDLGTGPYALFARAAMDFGARKVYAVEAVPESAARAREAVALAEAAPQCPVTPGSIEVLEGFSTDVELPEKVDVLISEIAGSIASEEGVYATIVDAQRRFMKRPRDPGSYVPFSYQTLGAPATDLCHHSGGADPTAPCLRIPSEDATLRMLADPLLVEDIRFAGDAPANGSVDEALAWRVDPDRVAANEAHFRAILEPNREAVEEDGLDVERLARDVSRSLSGIALWPRIVFDEAGTHVYDTRGPTGEQQLSHWPTVLPPLAPRPLPVAPGAVVTATWSTDLRDGQVSTPIRYSLLCDIAAEAAAAPAMG